MFVLLVDLMMIDLHSFRKLKKLSQQDIADRLNIKVSTYSKIERGDIQLTVSRLFELAEVFGIAPHTLLYNDFETKGSNSENVDERLNISYVPVSAQAGFLSDFSSDNQLSSTVKFSVPIFYEDDLYLIGVDGDSMYPTFCNGDFLVVKRSEKDSIKWGELYLIIGNDGQVVKRLYKGSDNSLLSLVSDNDMYDPYDVDKTSIRSIWQVKGVISKNLTPRTIKQEL
ncbi:MAG: LexA family transcriptional regulator [Marinoscillum sp.]